MQADFSKQIARLKEARNYLRLSLRQLSQMTGYAVSTIGNAEHGKATPSRRLLDRISQAMEVNPEWLENGIEPMFLPTSKGPASAVIQEKLQSNFAVIENLTIEVNRLHRKFGLKLDFDQDKNEGLTSSSESGNTAEVKSEMAALLAKVRELTAPPPRGKMAGLAAHLNVPQSRVSEWLAGLCKPDGENTLKLLRWVEQQERK